MKAKSLSVLAEVCLGFLLFPPAEGRGFLSFSKHVDQLEEASGVQMVPGFILTGLSGRSMKLTTLFHLNQSLRASGTMPLLSIRLHDVNMHSFTSNLILRQNYFLVHSYLFNIHNLSSLPMLACSLLKASFSNC
jgi:hypothetical protein